MKRDGLGADEVLAVRVDGFLEGGMGWELGLMMGRRWCLVFMQRR